MLKSCLLGLVLWGLGTGLAWAEPADLSFPQAFQQAHQHHPRLLQLRQQIGLAEARLPQAAAGLNPEVTLTNEDFLGSASWTPDRFTQFTLEWAQTFWLAAQPALREKVAAQQIALLRWEYLLAERQIWLELQQHFLRIPYLQQQGHWAEKLVAQAVQQLALTQRLVALGRVAPSELLAVEVALQQEEASLKHWQTLLRQEQLRLVLLWGGEPTELSRVAVPELRWQPSGMPVLTEHPRLLRWNTLKQ
jgi:outer membrane protein TolC